MQGCFGVCRLLCTGSVKGAMMVDMCLRGLRSCSPNSVLTLWSPCIQGRENRLLSHRGVATYTRCSWQAGNYQGSCVPVNL